MCYTVHLKIPRKAKTPRNRGTREGGEMANVRGRIRVRAEMDLRPLLAEMLSLFVACSGIQFTLHTPRLGAASGVTGEPPDARVVLDAEIWCLKPSSAALTVARCLCTAGEHAMDCPVQVRASHPASLARPIRCCPAAVHLAAAPCAASLRPSRMALPDAHRRAAAFLRVPRPLPTARLLVSPDPGGL